MMVGKDLFRIDKAFYINHLMDMTPFIAEIENFVAPVQMQFFGHNGEYVALVYSVSGSSNLGVAVGTYDKSTKTVVKTDSTEFEYTQVTETIGQTTVQTHLNVQLMPSRQLTHLFSESAYLYYFDSASNGMKEIEFIEADGSVTLGRKKDYKKNWGIVCENSLFSMWDDYMAVTCPGSDKIEVVDTKKKEVIHTIKGVHNRFVKVGPLTESDDDNEGFKVVY